MKTTRAIGLCVSLAATLAVASAMAQSPGRTYYQSQDAVPRPNPQPRFESDLANPLSRATLDRSFTTDGSEDEEDELVSETSELVQKLETAKSDNDREALKSKLSELIGKQFDVRQKRHKREIESLEAQVKKLKDLVQKRQDNRSEIISRRLDQLVRESQGLGF